MEAYQHTIRKIKEIEEIKNLPFNINDITLNNSIVREIDLITAKKMIIEYEWLKTIPLFNKYFFGIYFIVDNIEYLGGVVIYSEEYSANKSNIWDKYDFTNKILLLSRGVCLWWTPKNTASYFITKTIKWVRKNTNYKIITATVDPAAGEIGTIYQSLNWYYVGLMNGNYRNDKEMKRFAVYINGNLRHSRSIRKELGTIKKDIILEKYPDAVFVNQYRKRRYFYFIGNNKENEHYLDNIKHLILSYPKRNEKDIIGIIYLIVNKINGKKYVGQTTRGFYQRYFEYKTHASCCNQYIIKAFIKYGFENFEFRIIDTAKSLEELNEKEIKYIADFKCTNRNYGYNIENGGRSSKDSVETIEKLSQIRKKTKQTKEWVDKRIDAVGKPVVKVNIKTNEIVERYRSLADAGKLNKDGLSSNTISGCCLGYNKYTNFNGYIWCYESDFINNTIPEYKDKDKQYRKFEDLTTNELSTIYSLYKNDDIPIRHLSDKYSVHFSSLSKYIQNLEKPQLVFDKNKKYVVVCKKTKKRFVDFINKSGALTTHIKETYSDFKMGSLFKRKQIELKTGKPWYYDYFEFIEV